MKSIFLLAISGLFVIIGNVNVFAAADIEAVLDSADGSSSFVVQDSTGAGMGLVDSDGNMVIKGGMRLDSAGTKCTTAENLIVDGSVGIGMVSPAAKISIKGTTDDGSTNILEGLDSADASILNIDTDGNLTLGTTDTTAYADLLLYEEGNIQMADSSSGTQRIWFHQGNRIIFEVDSKAIFETSKDWNLGSNTLESNHQRRSDIDVVFRSGVDGQDGYGFMFDSTNGYVGLGVVQDTTAGDLPLERLHIDGNLRIDAGDIFLADDNYIGIKDNERIVFDSAGDIEIMDGNVGIGTNTPNAVALLDVSSTAKGFLPPRMTTVQRDAIATPPAGLMIYNATTNKLNFYNGSSWEAVTSA